MALLRMPTTPAGLAAIVVLSRAVGISGTLAFSSVFFSSSLQNYFTNKQEEIRLEGKKLPSPIRDFSQDAYQEGYLRGQREAYWDASNHLSQRGLIALSVAEGLVYAYLIAIIVGSVLRKRQKALVS